MTTVLLDVDGTLVDSTNPVLRSMNVAFRENGLRELSDAHLTTLIGPPLFESLAVILGEMGEDTDLVPRLVADFREVYVPLSVELAQSYPGVPEMLASLDGRVRVGVVTSKPKAIAGPILERLGFAPYFEVIEGPGLGPEVESKTTTLQRGLREMGVERSTEAVVMVGDRAHDVDAARACGVDSVGVTWGFGSREELETAGATTIIDHPHELLPVVDR